MGRVDVTDHGNEDLNDVHVRLDIALPAHPVHILDEDLRGAAHLEAALVVGIEVEPARQVAVGHTGPSR